MDGGTYESKTKHPQSANSMEQHPDAEYLQVNRADDQIIRKVPRCQSEDESAAAGISVNALLGGHGFALVVSEHDPQGHGVDHGALDEGDDMNIPVDLCAAVELIVVLREQP